MTVEVLSVIPSMIWIPASVLWALGRITRKIHSLMMACGWSVNTLACVMEHQRVWSYVSAALAAWELYVWWNSGGGDDTKRRLRKLNEKFTPVRRTAPAIA